MKICDPACDTVRDEMDVLRAALAPLHADGAGDAHALDVLELGCGTGDMTRRIADAWPNTRITALEVDLVQLGRNETRNRHANIDYRAGRAEAIEYGDASFDAVLMFKSLHHVSVERLDDALAEIHRVLRPGGIAYFAEPVYAGTLNDIIRLFHDEETVRLAAFDALRRTVASGRWMRAGEVHYLVDVHFADFADFERKVMRVTHSDFKLTDARVERVRAAFARHETASGADFVRPMRTDILRKPIDERRPC